MDTAALKSFATSARTELIREVGARITAVLAQGSPEHVEQPRAVTALKQAIFAGGGGDKGKAHVADKVAYTWFNRIIALRFMDANGYTGIGVVSPAVDQVGQPEVLAAAKRGLVDGDVVKGANAATINGLLNGTRQSRADVDAQAEAYALLLADYCRYWNRAMPFMFEREGDYTELLIPANLLAEDSVLSRSVKVLTEEVCQDVEVIGWLYQFYISERKDEVFAGFKKKKKAGADEIPAATQLFTPHWIVRYLVENSLGRLWMLNHPESHLVDQMEYYIAPVDDETGFLKITKPEELTVIDPACGSGHMLTYAFELLYAIYEEEGYTPSQIPSLILTNNLYGTEIDPRAGALAAFALTMKAAAKRKLFLKNPAEPNICVLNPISFSADELSYLVTTDGDRHAEEAFWNLFDEADTFGSLIQPDPALTARLSEHFATLDDEGDILRADALDWAQRVVTQAEYLLPRYAVAIANPPYMGSRNFSPRLAEWAGNRFPATRTDLYAMFIERCIRLLVPGGMEALVTMETWMFIRAHEPLRQMLLQSHSVETMAHLGSHAFDAIQGELVGTTAFVVRKGLVANQKPSTFVRLAEMKGEVEKSRALRQAASADIPGLRFDVNPSAFLQIDGQPIAYWLPPAVVDLLVKGRTLDAAIHFPSSAHKTGDNGAFLRKWWEVSSAHVGVHGRWVPYAKGGGSRRWFGLLTDVVDWSGPALSFYRTNTSSSLMKRDPAGPVGITYSMLTMGTNTFRVLPAGSAYDMGGPGFFTSGLTVPQVLAIVNSTMAATVLGALNPTINLQTRDIKKIPLPTFSPEAAAQLHAAAEEAIAVSESEWNESETSMGFEKAAIPAQGSSILLADFVLLRQRRVEERASRLEELEASLNSLVWEAVGVGPVSYRNHRGAGALDGSVPAAQRARDEIADLVSYAVGCMFGRYSLDEPGLILADLGATLQDYLAKVANPAFMPDADNVIPIVDGDWFEDDIVERFRQFLRAAFGEEHFEENLRFVTDSLGVKNLRDYFVKSFYKDHVQRYKKRPIYWLFSSPKGSFNALIYMHRYTPSTVSTVLTYLREYVTKLESALQQAERAGNAKEADRLRKILVELNEYEHDTLFPKASENVVIDLDDGVKANYPKFGAALKKIPGLGGGE